MGGLTASFSIPAVASNSALIHGEILFVFHPDKDKPSRFTTL